VEQERVRRRKTILYKYPESVGLRKQAGAQGIRSPPAAFFGASQERAGNRPGAMLLPTTVCVWWDKTDTLDRLVAHTDARLNAVFNAQFKCGGGC